MIIDSIANRKAYYGLGADFQNALDFLADIKEVSELPFGDIPIPGSNLVAFRVSSDGNGKNNAKAESHFRHIDIQYTAEGSDLIGWITAFPELVQNDFNEEKDVVFYKTTPGIQWVRVLKGFFTILYPWDIHAPLACDNHVEKIVIKVRN